METICNHDFEYDDIFKICTICGQEVLCMPNEDSTANSCYSVKLPQYELNKYLSDLSNDTKMKIITIFEELLVKKNLRGEGKKALLSVCYMYILLEEGNIITYRDVCSKFKIDRKKFSIGKQLFLTHYPSYRIIVMKSSDYIEKLLPIFKFNFTKELLNELQIKCKQIDNNVKFINFNPHSVCACIIFKTLEENGYKDIYKSQFTKKIGMSDTSVQKITNLLNKTI